LREWAPRWRRGSSLRATSVTHSRASAPKRIAMAFSFRGQWTRCGAYWRRSEGSRTLSQIAPFVGALCKNDTATAPLLYVVEGERTEGDSGIEMLDQAQEQMQEDALDADRIGLELIPTPLPPIPSLAGRATTPLWCWVSQGPRCKTFCSGRYRSGSRCRPTCPLSSSERRSRRSCRADYEGGIELTSFSVLTI
jgi:hypothetical protein